MICFLNHDMRENTGAGRFGRELIKRVRILTPGTEVRVLTTDGSGFPGEMPILYANKWRLIAALPKIRSIFKQSDIIHALDGFPYGVIAAVASLGLGKKVFITAIGSGAVGPLAYPVWGRAMSFAYRRAAKVIAISDYTRRKVLHHVPELDIEVINHGVDLKKFSREAALNLSASDWSKIRALKPYILSVGSPKPRKGFLFSIPAFAGLAKSSPQHPKLSNLRYVIVGDVDHGEISDLISSEGVRPRVAVFPKVSQAFLVALYREAELFLLMPYSAGKDVEGFGLVFLEAAAAGLPVVGTRGSGAEDAIRDGQNGILVRPRDSAAASEAMRRILTNEGLREKFSHGSVELAKRMSWQKVAERYFKIYDEFTPSSN